MWFKGVHVRAKHTVFLFLMNLTSVVWGGRRCLRWCSEGAHSTRGCRWQWQHSERMAGQEEDLGSFSLVVRNLKCTPRSSSPGWSSWPGALSPMWYLAPPALPQEPWNPGSSSDTLHSRGNLLLSPARLGLPSLEWKQQVVCWHWSQTPSWSQHKYNVWGFRDLGPYP